MSVLDDIQKLTPGTLITFYCLDLRPCAGKFGATTQDIFLWCDGVNEIGNDVVWSGEVPGVYTNISPRTYTRYPIHASGFDKVGNGQIPRPKLTVANINGLVASLARDYNDLIAARLVRVRTFLKYIDSVNFSSGNQFADPSQYLDRETWIIDRKSNENGIYVEWELTAPYDLAGVKLPRRQCIQNACTWKYKSAECGYVPDNVVHFYYNFNDEKVTDQLQDVCGKRLNSCKVRFSTVDNPNPTLPFGGFPMLGIR